MKKLHKARHFLAGAVAMALVMCLPLTARAALTSRTIEVLQGVDIYVDGVKMEPTDANGKPVETFVYNGTTYVPLRAVSQYLGKAVSWDGENQRAYIGEKPGEKQYLLDVCPPYATDGKYYNAPPTITMAGEMYTHGFYTAGYALFNLNGQYDTLSFDLGHVDETAMEDTTFTIYLDGQVALSLELSAEMLPEHYELPLHNALQMKVECGGFLGSRFAMANITVE